ncbi:MAG: redoxin domain-containing protein [Candidatus Eiseniibacteriota bacterium]
MRIVRESRIRAPELVAAGWATSDSRLIGAMRGSVVLLDFFSFADPAGVREIAHVRRLAEHYAASGLVVVGVHVPAYDFERPLEAARREIWRLGIPYPVALDQALSLFQAYECRNLPARYVIDAQGFVRAWHHGAGGLAEAERVVRTLLREARPDRRLPPLAERTEGVALAGRVTWYSTPEILFGTRGAGFGPPDSSGPAPADGETRTFGELPDLRAPGVAQLEGEWTVRADRIVSQSEEGAVAVVFEGSSVLGVLSPEGRDDREEDPHVQVILDGDPAAGIPDPLPVGEGRLYELVSSADFGIHNLHLRVRGRGLSLHLLHFGSTEVPEEA